MGSLKTQAVVLRYANYKDYDRILTLYSKEYGRIVANARGCRRPKSRLLACSQLFCFGEYVFNQKSERLSVTSCEIMDSFFDVSTGVDTFAYAEFILNVCEEAALPGEGSAEIFSLLVRTLSELCSGKRNPLAITVYFMLKLMDISGYRPNLDCCSHCGKGGETAYFSARDGGVICRECRADDSVRVSPEAVRAASCLLNGDMEAINAVPAGLFKEIAAFLFNYVECKFEKRFKSRAFLCHIA
ncbi:MAG: DNA repair protein RecO [Bacillota bacterium]|nr:DNA repair protein RecO [Bacillota bacterium]